MCNDSGLGVSYRYINIVHLMYEKARHLYFHGPGRNVLAQVRLAVTRYSCCAMQYSVRTAHGLRTHWLSELDVDKSAMSLAGLVRAFAATTMPSSH